jgi:hypothetical protein
MVEAVPVSSSSRIPDEALNARFAEFSSPASEVSAISVDLKVGPGRSAASAGYHNMMPVIDRQLGSRQGITVEHPAQPKVAHAPASHPKMSLTPTAPKYNA